MMWQAPPSNEITVGMPQIRGPEYRAARDRAQQVQIERRFMRRGGGRRR